MPLAIFPSIPRSVSSNPRAEKRSVRCLSVKPFLESSPRATRAAKSVHGVLTWLTSNSPTQESAGARKSAAAHIVEPPVSLHVPPLLQRMVFTTFEAKTAQRVVTCLIGGRPPRTLCELSQEGWGDRNLATSVTPEWPRCADALPNELKTTTTTRSLLTPQRCCCVLGRRSRPKSVSTTREMGFPHGLIKISQHVTKNLTLCVRNLNSCVRERPPPLNPSSTPHPSDTQ